MRLLSAESGLNGRTLTESMIESVVHQSLSAMSFQGDIHASEKYRRALMLEMVSKAFAQAMRPIN